MAAREITINFIYFSPSSLWHQFAILNIFIHPAQNVNKEYRNFSNLTFPFIIVQYYISNKNSPVIHDFSNEMQFV